MNQIHVLVVDDEIETGSKPRRKSYERLNGYAIGMRSVHVTFATSVADARHRLSSGQITLLVLDVVLKNWGDVANRSRGFANILAEASLRGVMIGLISRRWDTSAIGIARDALHEAKVARVPLFISTKDLEPERVEALVEQFHMYLSGHGDSVQIDKGPNEAVCLLHISDLHFGSADTEVTLAGEVAQQNLAQAITRIASGKPDIIAVTGDIADTGHPKEYDRAYKWFEGLAAALGFSLPSRRIVIVPGNHDFSVPLAAAQSIKVDRDSRALVIVETTDELLAKVAQQPFFDFFERICGSAKSYLHHDRGGWVATAFAEHGIVFTGLNSSASADQKSWPKRHLAESHLAAVLTSLSNVIPTLSARAGSPPLHVQLCHHSPVKYEIEQEIENYVEYANAFESKCDGVRPDIILHGHEHSRTVVPWSKDRVLLVAAATPSQRARKRPQDVARGFSVLRFERSSGNVTAVEMIDASYRAKSGSQPSGWKAESTRIVYRWHQRDSGVRKWVAVD